MYEPASTAGFASSKWYNLSIKQTQIIMLAVKNKITKKPTAKLVSQKNELAKKYPDAEFLGYVCDEEIYRVIRLDSGIVYMRDIPKSVRAYLDNQPNPKFVVFDYAYDVGLGWIRAYSKKEVESAIQELKIGQTNQPKRST